MIATSGVYAPSDVVLVTGVYALLNASGMPTIAHVPAFAGSNLPAAPPGWAWRLESRKLPPG